MSMYWDNIMNSQYTNCCYCGERYQVGMGHTCPVDAVEVVAKNGSLTEITHRRTNRIPFVADEYSLYDLEEYTCIAEEFEWILEAIRNHYPKFEDMALVQFFEHKPYTEMTFTLVFEEMDTKKAKKLIDYGILL